MKQNIPILIIENKTEEQDRIQSVLNLLQIKNQLVFATDSQSALSYLDICVTLSTENKMLPGLILLSYDLNGGDALGILKELKSHNIYSQIPVIVLSDFHNAADVGYCYDNGCNGFFQKNKLQDDLLKTMNIICNFWLSTVSLPYCLDKTKLLDRIN